MKDNERNDYGLLNPDGRITNVFESKNTSLNDSKYFTKENNVSGINEQEQVKEQATSKTGLRKSGVRSPTTNLVSVSGFFATTAVAVAGAVVVVAYVVAASVVLAMAELFAVTSDSLTFYVQCYMNEGCSNVARLYYEEQVIEEMPIDEPFLQFYELNADSSYVLEIFDTISEKVVFQKEFKTAPENTYGVGFETWIEENTLMLYPYMDEDFPIPEEVTAYTISVFDQKGNNIYKNTVEALDEEYIIELPEGIFTQPEEQIISVDDPSTNNPITDDGVVEIKEEFVYVSIVYNWNGYPVGNIQSVSNRGW